MKTIVGRVPTGSSYLDGSISKGEVIVVMCPGCKQPLIEYNDNIWLDLIESETYPQRIGWCIGTVERGSYGKTERMYCTCGITTETPDSYCSSGQFAICWDPALDSTLGGGCARAITTDEVPFDHESFNPRLEWFEVGVLRVHDPSDGQHKVFVECNCESIDYSAECLGCGLTGTVSKNSD